MFLNMLIQESINSDSNTFRICTLGPVGTSSEHAARYVMSELFPNEKSQLLLYDNFEICISELLSENSDIAVVPHAYPGINNFYMHPEIQVLDIFRADTPLYGLAVRQDFDFREEMLDSETVLSHSAPVPLIKHYLNREIKIELVSSTSVAARKVRDFEKNIAVTNQQAIEVYGLKFVKEFKVIPMSWTIFSKDKNKSVL